MQRRIAVNFDFCERIAFYAVVLFFASQLSLNETVLTYDGPSHVYNAGIIKEKLFHGGSFFDIFQFNNTPNWSTHFILALLQLFVSSEVSERILLFLLIILFNYSFRRFVLSWFPKAHHIAWLSIIFSFNFFFYFGFYNFIFGLIIGFLLLRKRDRFLKNEWISFIYYLSLWFILSFTHAFVFLLLAGIVLWEFIFYWILGKFNILNGFKQQNAQIDNIDKSHLFKLIKMKLIGTILPSMVILLYLLKPLPNKFYVYLSFDEIISFFKLYSPLVVFNSDIESQHSNRVILVLVVVTAIYLLFNLIKYRWTLFNGKNISKEFLFWLPVFVGSLFLVFLTPDSDGYVGYICIRMVFLTIIFGIFLLSSIRIHVMFRVLIMILVVSETLQVQSYRLANLNELGVYTKSLRKAGKYINTNSFTLLYSLEGNWFLRHAGMIAFEDNHSISLDNYEAEHPLFPISWKQSNLPDIRIGEIHSGELSCFTWASNSSASPRIVEYVLLFGKEDQIKEACELEMWQHIKKEYSMIYSNQHVVLLTLKKGKHLYKGTY